MIKWKTNLAQDSDGLYNAQQMINQLTQGLPLANESTVQLADTPLDENSDWSKINYNEYYLFNSLSGLNAPDKQSLIYDRGLTIRIGDDSEFIQLAITPSCIGVKYNNTDWAYSLNESGGSGNQALDNKGTVIDDFHNYTQTGIYTYDTGKGAIANSIGNAPDGVLVVITQPNGNVYHYLMSSYSERYFEIYMGGGWHGWRKQVFEDDLANFIQHPFSKSVDDMNNETADGLFFNTNLNALNSPFPGGAFYWQGLGGVWGRIRQIAYDDLDASKYAMRISSDGGQTWSNWDYMMSTEPIQIDGDMDNVVDAGYYRTSSAVNTAPGSDYWTVYQVIPLKTNGVVTNGIQEAFNTNKNNQYSRTWVWDWDGNKRVFSDWVMLADDTAVVHKIENETIQGDKVFNGSVMFEGDIEPVDLGDYNVDDINKAGIYSSYGNLKGLPGQAYGILEVVKNDTDVLQRYTQTNTNTPFTWQRIKNNNIGGWSSWASVTTAATLFSEEINNDQSLIDLNTDKAVYNPSERVEFEGYISSNSGKIKVEYYRREILMNTQIIPFMAGIVNWCWYLPSVDEEQYYAKITVVTNSGEGNPQYVAINVDSSGKHVPIMGFLSSYGEYDPNKEKSIINDLKRHHINYIQYYDCYERPEHLIRTNLTGEDSQAGTSVDYWKDLSRHQVRADVLREYITLGKRSGIKNMIYMPWGNTSAVAGDDGITARMLLYNDQSKVGDNSAVPATLQGGDGQWARYSLMQANPSDPDFKNMLFESAQKALETMGFDGLHIDTLGPNYDNTYTDDGAPYSSDFAASSGMPLFINDAANYFNTDSWQKTGSNIRMSFNNVGSWGIDDLANNSNLDFLYAEQWPSMGNTTYGDMIKKIMYINSKSTWQRVVIPAYMHGGSTNSSTTFNTNGVILTNLVIMASGATHLELGEHMLDDEYFPNDKLSMNDDLKEWEINYYDFIVAYARMFNIKNYTSNTSSTSHKIIHNDFDETFDITAIEQEDNYLSAVSLINTKDINGDTWQDLDFSRNEPTKLTNVSLSWQFKPTGVYYCTIENPQPQKLVPDENNCVIIPELDRYALVYAYK